VRILLDTHLLLWAIIAPERIGSELRDILENGSAEILFSAASMWEIAIKVSLGRADFGVEPGAIFRSAREMGFIELPVRTAVALMVATLPWHHRDPFDRLLVAQAMSEPALLYTADSKLEAYSELVRRV
jgi:PIN domain nuclease of toxin-antitoxin system